jgi:hypothetical protein
MPDTFRMRIGSCSEGISARYAFDILPVLACVTGKQLSPVQIMREQHTDLCPFVDVKTWDWPTSINRLRELVWTGANIVILSNDFLDWNTPADAINNDLYRFEDELSALGVSVLSVESYSDKQQTEMPNFFSKVTQWHTASLNNIVREMLDGFKTETLCCPYGYLPYLLIDPDEAVQSEALKQHFRALVGFQPWQYDRILQRWPTPEFPLKHWRPIPQKGAIPMEVELDQTPQQDTSNIRGNPCR